MGILYKQVLKEKKKKKRTERVGEGKSILAKEFGIKMWSFCFSTVFSLLTRFLNKIFDLKLNSLGQVKFALHIAKKKLNILLKGT